MVGAAAGKQSHDPESRKQPAQLCYLLALTGIEVEAVKEGFSINARVSPRGYVLDEVGKLRSPVAAAGAGAVWPGKRLRGARSCPTPTDR